MSSVISRGVGFLIRRTFSAERGLACSDELIFWGEFTQDGGYRTARRALQAEVRPTALFAANNFIAVGALQALREANLRVPEAIALVCFDDIPPALAMEPFLTVASQPAYELGRKATELLLARINGQGPPDFQKVVLPVEIIVRKSSSSTRSQVAVIR